jgi:hypothetical protein
VGLKHLTLNVETIVTPAGDFTVRGLNFDDISTLVRLNFEALSAVFANAKMDAKGEIKDLKLNNTAALAGSLATSAPQVVAQIIALGADEDDLSEVAKIPFPNQLEALEAIGKLTFATEGSPKKVLETVIRIVNGATSTLGSLKT